MLTAEKKGLEFPAVVELPESEQKSGETPLPEADLKEAEPEARSEEVQAEPAPETVEEPEKAEKAE